MNLILEAQLRDEKEKPNILRKNGFLPVVFYGSGIETFSLKVNKQEFEKIFKKVGNTGIFSLKTPKGTFDVMIKDVAFNPVTNEAIHADIFVIDIKKTIIVKVPLEFIGFSEAAKEGGIIVKNIYELEIETLPKNVPEKIEVDLSLLKKIGDHILVKDIQLPLNIKVLDNPEEIVVSAVSQNKEEVVIETTPDFSQIEVEKKGKKEEDGSEK